MSRLEIIRTGNGFEVRLGGCLAIEHGPGRPFLSAGRGEGRYDMHHGNFEVTESLEIGRAHV